MPGSAEYQRQWAAANRRHLRDYHARWVEAHPERVRDSARKSHEKNRDERLAYIRERKERNRQHLAAIKFFRGCVDCGTREGKLEFDHRPGEIKLFAVSGGTSHSWDKIRAEILKCDVRCSRCHRLRHIALRREAGTAPWMTRA